MEAPNLNCSVVIMKMSGVVINISIYLVTRGSRLHGSL